MTPTVFEKIIAGELPCAKVYEDSDVFAFMDAGQVNPGHVIVASRKPFATLMDADEQTARALFAAARRIARAVDAAFSPAGITVLQANRPAGWQTVPHLHLHVLPRHADDGVTLGWPRKNPPLEELKRLAGRIVVSVDQRFEDRAGSINVTPNAVAARTPLRSKKATSPASETIQTSLAPAAR